jgi:hypothetical protein
METGFRNGHPAAEKNPTRCGRAAEAEIHEQGAESRHQSSRPRLSGGKRWSEKLLMPDAARGSLDRAPAHLSAKRFSDHIVTENSSGPGRIPCSLFPIPINESGAGGSGRPAVYNQ